MASTGGVMLLGRITYPDHLYCDRPQVQKDTAPHYYLSCRLARRVADLRGLPSVGSDEILAATGRRERTLEQEPSAQERPVAGDAAPYALLLWFAAPSGEPRLSVGTGQDLDTSWAVSWGLIAGVITIGP